MAGRRKYWCPASNHESQKQRFYLVDTFPAMIDCHLGFHSCIEPDHFGKKLSWKSEAFLIQFFKYLSLKTLKKFSFKDLLSTEVTKIKIIKFKSKILYIFKNKFRNTDQFSKICFYIQFKLLVTAICLNLWVKFLILNIWKF